MKIGLYGGTFNPIHNAHLAMAQFFIEQMQLDKCYIVPSFISPFKVGDSDVQLISNDDRLKLIQLAIAEYSSIEMLDYEIKREGVSFTIDTIDFLISSFPNDKFCLLIGADQAVAFDKWKDWEKIANSVQICVVGRPDVDMPELRNKINAIFSGTNCKPLILQTPMIDITSTMVREKIKSGEPISDLVPAAVAKYISQRKLYL